MLRVQIYVSCNTKLVSVVHSHNFLFFSASYRHKCVNGRRSNRCALQTSLRPFRTFSIHKGRTFMSSRAFHQGLVFVKRRVILTLRKVLVSFLPPNSLQSLLALGFKVDEGPRGRPNFYGIQRQKMTPIFALSQFYYSFQFP